MISSNRQRLAVVATSALAALPLLAQQAVPTRVDKRVSTPASVSSPDVVSATDSSSPVRIANVDVASWPALRIRLETGGTSGTSIQGLIGSDIAATLGTLPVSIESSRRSVAAGSHHLVMVIAGAPTDEMEQTASELLRAIDERLEVGDTISVIAATDSLRFARWRIPDRAPWGRTIAIDSGSSLLSRALASTPRGGDALLLLLGNDSLCGPSCATAALRRARGKRQLSIVAGDAGARRTASLLAARQPDTLALQTAVEAILALATAMRPKTKTSYDLEAKVGTQADGAPRELRITVPSMGNRGNDRLTVTLPLLSTPAGAGGGGEATARASVPPVAVFLLLGVTALLALSIVAVAAQRRHGRRRTRG